MRENNQLASATCPQWLSDAIVDHLPGIVSSRALVSETLIRIRQHPPLAYPRLRLFNHELYVPPHRSD